MPRLSGTDFGFVKSWNEAAFGQAVHIQLQPLLAARASDVHSRPVGNGRSQAHKIQMVPRADWGRAKLKALISAVLINWQLDERLSDLPEKHASLQTGGNRGPTPHQEL